jgi:hypothetical protein
MEEERRESKDEWPGEDLKIPEEVQDTLKVDLGAAVEREAAQQAEAKKLREQVEKTLEDKTVKPAGELPVPVQDNHGEKLAHKKSESVFKKMGARLGKSLSWVADSLRSRVDNFDIEYSGGENIKELEGKPYILAANHIKPKNIAMQAMGISPDSFVLEKIGGLEGEKKPRIITNVTGKVSKVPVLGLVDKIWSPFREGVMEGMGFIPVKTKKGGKRGGFNRNFVENIREAKKNGEPIIIFPQGGWGREFDPNAPFDTGAATIAQKYNLPIVPVYIEGADSFGTGQKVNVRIGASVNPEDKTKEELTAEMGDAITALSGKFENEQ